MTREPCAFSIARIAWARLRENHRPISSGCRTIAASKIHINVEKSNDMRTSGNSRHSCSLRHRWSESSPGENPQFTRDHPPRRPSLRMRAAC